MSGRLHDLDYRVLVEHLTDIRRRIGMTQAELAQRLNRPQSYVSKVERFERRLDIGEWRRMALALDQSPADIFEEAASLLDDMDLLSETPASTPPGATVAGKQVASAKPPRRGIK
jgi:transcriptional regulator with XRE-family HTH domain